MRRVTSGPGSRESGSQALHTVAAAAAIAFGSVLLLSPRAASAATIEVTTLADAVPFVTGDGCSLREAIANADADDVVAADCAPGSGSDVIGFARGGTIVLAAAFPTITSGAGLTIDGGLRPIELDARWECRHFVVGAGAALTLRAMLLRQGMAPHGAGGIFTNPQKGEPGGSILNYGSLRLESVRISEGTAGTGGSVFKGIPGIGGDGGAIANIGPTSNLGGFRVTFDRNWAGWAGSNGDTRFGNVRGGNGGAIYHEGSQLVLVGATFFLNEGGGSFSRRQYGLGGAIYTTGNSVFLAYSTVFANTAERGSGIFRESGDVALLATMLANYVGAGIDAPDCTNGGGPGSFQDLGYNLELYVNCTDGAVGSVENVVNLGTTMGALAYHGGLVPTVPLFDDSPARDHIPPTDCPVVTELGMPDLWTSDARQFPRPSPVENDGGCDVGAVEWGTPWQTITFAQPATPAPFGTVFTVSPSSDSGLPVTVTPWGGCSATPSASGYEVTMTSATEDCVLLATQPGDGQYPPAVAVERVVHSAKQPQTLVVTVPAPPAAAIGATFPVFATGGESGNPIVLGSSGACSNVDELFTMTASVGPCTVTIDQAGNEGYLPAAQVTAEVTAIAGDGGCFTSLPPCRLLDTRLPGGGGRLTDGVTRVVPAVGTCGLVPGRQAIAVNLTAVTPSDDASVALHAAGEAPGEGRLSLSRNQTRATQAIVTLSDSGELGITPTIAGGGDVDVVVDIAGYFEGAETPTALDDELPGDADSGCVWVTLKGAPDSAHLEPEILRKPAHGLLDQAMPTGRPNEWLACYRPFGGFHGSDSFEYLVRNRCLANGTSFPATIEIHILEID